MTLRPTVRWNVYNDTSSVPLEPHSTWSAGTVPKVSATDEDEDLLRQDCLIQLVDFAMEYPTRRAYLAFTIDDRR